MKEILKKYWKKYWKVLKEEGCKEAARREALGGRHFNPSSKLCRLPRMQKLYILQFEQNYFTIWTNTYVYLAKYICQFREIHFALWTNIFQSKLETLQTSAHAKTPAAPTNISAKYPNYLLD